MKGEMNKMEQNSQEQTTMKGVTYMSWGYQREKEEKQFHTQEAK